MDIKDIGASLDVMLITPKDGVGREYLHINNFAQRWSIIDPDHIQFIADNHFNIECINFDDKIHGYYLLASREIKKEE